MQYIDCVSTVHHCMNNTFFTNTSTALDCDVILKFTGGIILAI